MQMNKTGITVLFSDNRVLHF